MKIKFDMAPEQKNQIVYLHFMHVDIRYAHIDATVEINLDKEEEYTVDFKPIPGVTMLVRLYSNCIVDKSTRQSHSHLGSGCSEEGLTVILIRDQGDRCFARISGLPMHVEHPFNRNESTPDFTAIDDLQKQIEAAYKDDDVFIAFDVRFHERKSVPLLFATLVTNRIMDGDVGYYANMLSVAHYLSAYEKPDSGSLLADMIGTISTAWLYRRDLTTNGEDIDFWQLLLTYPRFDLASYDCEDGTLALMQLFNSFKRLSVASVESNQELAAVHKLAQLYTPMLAIGGVLGSDGLGEHCFMLLMDAEMVAARIKGEAFNKPDAQPTLVVDSTVYAFGAPRLNEPQEIFPLVVLDEASSTDAPLIRKHHKASILVNQTIYRTITTLVTSSAGLDANDPRSCHFKIRLGKASVNEFLMNHVLAASCMEKVFAISTIQWADMNASLLAWIPRGVMPKAPTTPNTFTTPRNPFNRIISRWSTTIPRLPFIAMTDSISIQYLPAPQRSYSIQRVRSEPTAHQTCA